MKLCLGGILALAMALSAPLASAQTISPECATAAANAGVAQGYNVTFDRANGTCVATPLGQPVVSTQTAPAAAGAGAGAGIGGLGAILPVIGVGIGGGLLIGGLNSTGGT